MNGTINYYDKHASQYFERTSQVDLVALYKEFLKYIPEGGRIMDLGCGSGRDVKWFREHDYDAYGLDASEELVKIARNQFDIPVEVGLIEEWVADEVFDGIWCCASLMHLDDMSFDKFLSNLRCNLRLGGALFISVKEGIDSGVSEDGRYFRDFNDEALNAFISHYRGLRIEKVWYTTDKLYRESFRWLNAIIRTNEK
ncbi:MAG: class I SAM-dependent methyltransferase [Lachnospiraceae bacterium]|nr:class I SAM-dependent methyltransferase [Lachnospiraceae bacterium]